MRVSVIILILAAQTAPATAAITKTAWGETPGHQKVALYTLSNRAGITARIATYGGMLVDLRVPDRNGTVANIVRGQSTLDDYFARHVSLYGSIVGRYGNRIKGGQFTLDGKTYHLPINSQGNTLHGGPIGFDQRVWTARTHDGPSPSLTLSYTSLDGEMNFPGTLKVSVTYTLTGHDLRVDFRATTDKPTVLDLFVHPWFNLKGAGEGNILDHRLQIFADQYAAMDRSHSPTGRLVPVTGTPFDFRQPTPVGKNIRDLDWQISGDPRAVGYDQQFAINGKAGLLRPAARVEEPSSGRVLEVLTTQPDLGLYTSNFSGKALGRDGEQYGQYGAIVLETQHFGNSPNISAFPSTTLRPGEVYRETTVFRFSTIG